MVLLAGDAEDGRDMKTRTSLPRAGLRKETWWMLLRGSEFAPELLVVGLYSGVDEAGGYLFATSVLMMVVSR